MKCSKCNSESVIKLTNNSITLCRNHFIKYFEAKVIKTIRVYKLIKKGDRVLCALSGGKDSLSLLNLLKQYRDRRVIKLEAICIDEGIKKYRSREIKEARNFCRKNKIPFHIYTFKKEFGYPLTTLIRKLKTHPCTLCGVLRRNILNRKARKLGFNKLATGHNMDDECQTILMNQFRNNMAASARLGPITGVRKDNRFVQRIKPLYFILEKETKLYSKLKGLKTDFTKCPYKKDVYRQHVEDMVEDFEKRYPGTKFALINSFMKILPLLKKNYKQLGGELNSCSICREPCSGDICRTCALLQGLKPKTAYRVTKKS